MTSQQSKYYSRVETFGNVELYYNFPKPDMSNIKMKKDYYESAESGNVNFIKFETMFLTLEFKKDGKYSYMQDGKKKFFSIRMDLFEKNILPYIDKKLYYEMETKVRTDKKNINVVLKIKFGV